jgi:hypothetical protein
MLFGLVGKLGDGVDGIALGNGPGLYRNIEVVARTYPGARRHAGSAILEDILAIDRYSRWVAQCVGCGLQLGEYGLEFAQCLGLAVNGGVFRFKPHGGRALSSGQAVDQAFGINLRGAAG